MYTDMNWTMNAHKSALKKSGYNIAVVLNFFGIGIISQWRTENRQKGDLLNMFLVYCVMSIWWNRKTLLRLLMRILLFYWVLI